MHDATDHNLAFALSRLSDQDLTHTVIGVFRNVARSTYDDAARAQVQLERQNREPDLQALLNGRDTWTVADRRVLELRVASRAEFSSALLTRLPLSSWSSTCREEPAATGVPGVGVEFGERGVGRGGRWPGRGRGGPLILRRRRRPGGWPGRGLRRRSGGGGARRSHEHQPRDGGSQQERHQLQRPHLGEQRDHRHLPLTRP